MTAEIKDGHIIVSDVIAPMPHQLALEIELFNTILASLPLEDSKSIGIARSEIMTRSDLYKQCMRQKYVRYVEIRSSEKLFLSALFYSVRGYNWKQKFGWVGQKKMTGKPEIGIMQAIASLFYGIKTTGDKVTEISLSSNNLDGTLPDSIGSISSCKFLYLNWNRIKGKLPKNLKNLGELEVLQMFSNRLQGTLDCRTLESLVSLRSLNLSFNLLSGVLPDAFENLINLVELNLSGNKFSGDLPDSMRRLVNLEILKLYNNGFSGDIPFWIRDLTRLKEVNISQNQ